MEEDSNMKDKALFLFFLFISLFIITVNVSALPFGDPYNKLVGQIIEPIEEEGLSVAVIFSEEQITKEKMDILTTKVTEALTRQDITVVERQALDNILEEQKLKLSGIVSGGKESEIGEALGANFIVTVSAQEIRKEGYQTIGLNVHVRLVSVKSGKVVSSASTEVEKDDPSTPYKRKELQGPSEYPTLLSIHIGGNSYGRFYFKSKPRNEETGLGVSGGLRYTKKSSGFFARSWELSFGSEKARNESYDAKSRTFAFGRNYLLRVPVWRYWPALPYLSHAYAGANWAFGIVRSATEQDDYWGVELKIRFSAGWTMGLNDALSLYTEYRYAPRYLHIGWEGFGSQDYLPLYQLRNHRLYIGLNMTP